MKSAASWGSTICSFVGINQRFKGAMVSFCKLKGLMLYKIIIFKKPVVEYCFIRYTSTMNFCLNLDKIKQVVKTHLSPDDYFPAGTKKYDKEVTCTNL